MKLEEEAERKRACIKTEIQNYLKEEEVFSSDLIEGISEDILKNFIRIKPPVEDFSYFEIITEQSIGRATSRKAGNIRFNLRKLIDSIPGTILGVAGSVAGGVVNPLLLLLTCLVLWKNHWSKLRDIELSEKHAAVILVMWNNRNYRNNTIEEKKILPLVMKELENRHRPSINESELNQILAELERIKCIEVYKRMTDKKVWWLREWVQTTF